MWITTKDRVSVTWQANKTRHTWKLRLIQRKIPCGTQYIRMWYSILILIQRKIRMWQARRAIHPGYFPLTRLPRWLENCRKRCSCISRKAIYKPHILERKPIYMPLKGPVKHPVAWQLFRQKDPELEFNPEVCNVKSPKAHNVENPSIAKTLLCVCIIAGHCKRTNTLFHPLGKLYCEIQAYAGVGEIYPLFSLLEIGALLGSRWHYASSPRDAPSPWPGGLVWISTD